jgi:hypothetical protein
VDWQRRQPALLHLAQRCRQRVAEWSRFPSRQLSEVLKSNRSWHHRWRLGALVEVTGLSDRQMQQCQLDQPVGRFTTGELRCPPLVLEPLAPE